MATNKYTAAHNANTHLYTKGGEYSLDGKDYVGEYHLQDVTAQTGPVPSSQSKTLHRVYKNSDHYVYDKVFSFNVPVLNYIDPIPYRYQPNEQVYALGSDIRFFVEKKDDDNSYAIEIDSLQYDKINLIGGIDGGLYNHTAVEWRLTGRRDDIIKFNQYQIQKASSVIPTIEYAIKNYLEFARITLV